MGSSDRLRFDKTLNTEKRIETGSFYTPPELAELMVCLSLSALLEKRLKGFSQATYLEMLMPESFSVHENSPQELPPSKIKAVGKVLKSLKVLDLCAGSGVFPLAYLKVVTECLMRYGLENENKLTKLATQISSQIVAIDIQPEPLALYCQELHTLYGVATPEQSVFCLDALSDEALSQHPLLQQEMEGGFDLVLGNPPYLGEKYHKDIFQALRKTAFGAKYYEGRMDYFYFFLYRGMEALKPDGQLCMITTNYFATADGAKLLRRYFNENTHWGSIINFNDCSLFKDALGQHNVIFVLSHLGKNLPSQLCYPSGKVVSLKSLYEALVCEKENSQWHYEHIPRERLFDQQGMLKMLPSKAHQGLLEKLQTFEGEQRPTLGQHFHVQQGIVSGFDRDFKADKGVFVLTNKEAEGHTDLNHFLKPFYKNSQVRKYKVIEPTQYQILYVSETIDDQLEASKALFSHLQPYYERLAARREVVKKIRPWYALQWPRESWRFSGPLIAAPQRAYVNVFAYEENHLFGSADLYYISDRIDDNWRRERTLWTMAYLNSPVVYYWLALMGKRKGSMLELYATPLKTIPIVLFDPENPQHIQLVLCIQSMLSALEKGVAYEVVAEEHLKPIHSVFYELLGLSHEDIEGVEGYYQSMGAAEIESNYWYTK